MNKYFLVNPKSEHQQGNLSESIEKERIEVSKNIWHSREQIAEDAMQKECTLKCVHGKVIVKVNIESKNYHRFSDGTVIRRERKYNNFNFREVNPSNGFVVSAENIPNGAEVLFDYTSMHDSYRIFDYESGSNDVQFYSLREEDCFAWRVGKGEWQPTANSEFGLRVYAPYTGFIQGIEPTLVKDVLYVTTGELKGKVVKTLKGCDYVIVYQNDEGREGNILRFRHSNRNYTKEEVVGVLHSLTDMVKSGEYYVGLNPKDAKPIV